ncbi:octanoyltransferase LIP2, mitochondrial [Arachis duranensis]|uniref:lipoyl(octanoyl) transferase n=3 Tax=Arachis TaxID=3817 RepID=A0A445BF73_ARAHY|nr:octanoyltransferase LIP2, mitochondrial [Arachis duranensis]XP_025620416.1 octanoyltransferase LIP2, mitochondrial [Arachis hypogaea]QHO35894.1 Octanoyltransferase [Arachis hypogaea]RYR37327.1 hypothetical protein Ahy_A09g042230 [Arachis hypogaea]
MQRCSHSLQHHQLELPYSLIDTSTCKLFSKSIFNDTTSFNITFNFSIAALIGMRVLRSLEVLKLGVVNYLDALKLQEKLVLDRKSHRICDTLLSLQHPPTYTVGKRQTVHNLLIPQSELEQIGAELHYTQRGGDITFHGPHQAILYPIISLRDMGIGARSYVEKMELTMIEMAAQYGVKACPGLAGETGVWVGERKIGAIGVRISNGITSHGLAFNIDPDLSYFRHIVPCGIADKEVTSLRRETDSVLPPEEIMQEQLVSCFARIFGYDNLIWKEDASVVTDGTE